MTGKDLFKGINFIDEELLAEALDSDAAAAGDGRKNISVRGRRRRNVTQYVAMAASLAIVVLIGSTAYRNGIFNRVPGETPASAASGSMESTSAPSEPARETVVEPASEPVKDLYTEGADTTAAPAGQAPAYIEHTDGQYVTVTAADPGSVNMGVDQPVAAGGAASADPESVKYRQMISSYGDMGSVDACYAAPKNGEVCCSIPLRNAMDAMKQYGDDVLYRVYVDLFEDEQPLEWSDVLIDKFSSEFGAQGPIVAIETVLQDGEAQRTAFTLHATYDQLQSLRAPEGCGLMLFLYDEIMQP